MKRAGELLVLVVLCSLTGLAFAGEAAKEFQSKLETFRAEKHYGQAIALLNDEIKKEEQANGPNSERLMRLLQGLGGAHMELGEFSEAEPSLEQAIRILETNKGPDYVDIAVYLMDLESAYLQDGKADKAEAAAKRSLEIIEKQFGPDDARLWNYLRNLSLAYTASAKHDEAARTLERAISLREKAAAKGNEKEPEGAVFRVELAEAYQAAGRKEEAKKQFESALATLKQATTDDPDEPGILPYVAKAHLGLNNVPEAERLLAQSIEMSEKKGRLDDLGGVGFLEIAAKVYGQMGNAAKVQELEQRVKKIRD